MAGRRVGAQVTYKLPMPYKPKVQFGAFQSLALGGGPRPGTADQGYGLLALFRGAFEPAPGIEVDAWAQSRLAHEATSAVPHREVGGGADASFDFDDIVGPRAWTEFSTGSSALDATPASTDRVHFVAARAIASWRIGHRSKRWYLEPYGTGSVLDPDRTSRRTSSGKPASASTAVSGIAGVHNSNSTCVARTPAIRCDSPVTPTFATARRSRSSSEQPSRRTMRSSLVFIVGVVAAIASGCGSNSSIECAGLGDTDEFVTQIGCESDFEVLASKLLDATIPSARSGKTIIDREDGNALYFQNSNLFTTH